MSRINWEVGSAEQKVTTFYQHGVENFGDFHKGYLNFGLWENGNTDYIQAAENLIHRLGELLELKDSNLLDVACGMGAQDVYLHQNFSVKSITALDLMYEHLEYGKNRALEANLEDKIDFVNDTATKLPFNDQTFDRVLCVEGLIHFDTRNDFFKEAYRCMKDDGVMVVSDYCLAKTPTKKWQQLAVGGTCKMWNIPRENVSTISEYKSTLEKIGFTDVEIIPVGKKVIPGYFKEQHSKECLEELTRIRGFFAGRIGHIIDHAVYRSFKWGLIDYILVKARKKSPCMQ